MLKYIFLGVSLLVLNACTGEKGLPGPAGASGTNGTNGTNGTAPQGTTGNTGPAGDKGPTGDKGAQATAKIVSSSWISYKNIALGTATVRQHRVDADANFTIEFITLLGSRVEVGIASNENTLPVYETATKKLVGNLHFYNRLYEGQDLVVFARSSYSESVEIITAQASTLSFMAFLFPKTIVSNPNVLVPLISNEMKPAIRFVYVPVELNNGRMAHLDMSDYKAVKQAFGLTD